MMGIFEQLQNALKAPNAQGTYDTPDGSFLPTITIKTDPATIPGGVKASPPPTAPQVASSDSSPAATAAVPAAGAAETGKANNTGKGLGGVLSAIGYNILHSKPTGGPGGVGIMGEFDPKSYVEGNLQQAMHADNKNLFKAIGGLIKLFA